MDDATELRLRLRVTYLEDRLAALYAAAFRVVSRVAMPAHVTAASYSTSDTKRVPSRPLATLRNLIERMEAEQ